MYALLQNTKIKFLLPLILIAIGSTITYRIAFSGPTLQDARSYYVPFDQSMKVHQYPHVLRAGNNQAIYDIFARQYEAYSLKNVPFSQAAKIPKIIHIMWLGGKLPEIYERFVQSWYKHHPDWTILFWTDNASNYDRGTTVVKTFDELSQALQTNTTDKQIVIDTAQLAYDNRAFYDAAVNYGEKSDILKWEIVYRFGGVYVDIDFECFKPLDIFHHRYDFYTGIQPLDTDRVQLGAALYGAIAGHPILKRCVETIKNNQHINQIVVKTGPIHFTRCFLQLAGRTGLKDVAFPSSYFYPCDYHQAGMPEVIWRQPESFAIHHWAGSWLKPEGFVPGALEKLQKEGKVKINI